MCVCVHVYLCVGVGVGVFVWATGNQSIAANVDVDNKRNILILKGQLWTAKDVREIN